MEEQLSSVNQEYYNDEAFKHIEVPNFRQIQNPNFILPGYQLLQRNSYKPFQSSLKQFSNKKEEGIYIHRVIEEYLKQRSLTQQIQSRKWIEKFGSQWIFIVIEKVIFYMKQRGLINYKVEYVTTNSSLTKRFDVIFHDDNLEKFCIIDWKYSEWQFENILKLFQQHFKDQLFEAMKQFNTSNVTLIIVPLKQIHNFTIQEITCEDLFKTVKQISSDLNTLSIKYQQYYNQIKEKQEDILLKPSEIGISKRKNELLFENISNILKINSQQQIHYYLNLENLNNDIQPKNKDQFWIIHIFLSEILVKKNEYFQNILNNLAQKQSFNQNQVTPESETISKSDINQLKNQIECLSLTQERGYSIFRFDKYDYLHFEI
ncbi:hypothetical protein TTHERM_00317460 (macronuclear) [Tetrahymena thermophila SB210]|uniref:Uncharacterized protein n=1 Tax=Tetrahymena thermophila (strain SB210) TaxID=312017 RepID=I7M2S0_TETTS|nr:hypothetical protein TTHERM_00317460 [Tetrahymena thermophila SB210]EAS01182.2 hypothetical protein TTHERM_00317460 [Tetrahymena thermophila SB210]|eukprot:XP_001021427.2 hypothetical protein TTHERM_00317460 [Tetrahymena thermophila SB210]